MAEQRQMNPLPRRGSIVRRLMAWGLALLGVALVVNTAAGLFYSRQEVQRSTTELQRETASMTARYIESFVSNKIERLQDAGLAMSLYPLGSAEQRLLGQLALKNDPAFSELSLLDDDGRELFKFSDRRMFLPADLTVQKSSPAFSAAIRGSVYAGPVYTSDRAEPFITLAVPLKLGPAKTIGVLMGQTNLKFLWEVIGTITFGHGGYAYLVDRQGNLIAHKDPSLVLKKTNLRDLPKVAQFLRQPAVDSLPGSEGRGITGEEVMSTFAHVPKVGWGLIVEEPVALARSGVKKLEYYAVVLLLAGLSVGATVIVWLSNRISKPILELRAGAQIIRGGNLDHRVQVKTDDEIEDLAEEFNNMSAALKNSRGDLEQKVARRTEELSALYDVSTAVNESLELEGILQAVIKKITEIFHFDTTRIFLYNESVDQFDLRASFELDPEQWQGLRSFKRGEGVVGRVGDSGEPMIFEDVLTDSRYPEVNSSKRSGIAAMRFFGVIPIKTQSRTFGALLFNGKAPRKLSQEEAALLSAMAGHIAVAVEKSILFEKVQARSRHLSALNTIGEAVRQSLDLEIVLNQAVEKIADTLGFDASWIYLLDASGTVLSLTAQKGLSREKVAIMASRPITLGLSGLVIESQRPLVFEDTRTDAEYRRLLDAGRIQAMGFVTTAGFPITAKDKIIGSLHVGHHTKQHFTSDGMRLVESVAHAIGIAVVNATLFREVKEKTDELAQINEELRIASQAKSEFIAAMSHELRTPLNLMMGNAELAENGFFGWLNSEQKAAMASILRNGRLLLKMVNDVLALARMEAKKMSVDVVRVEIAEIIGHVTEYANQMNRDKQLEFRCEIDPSVSELMTDPVKLEEILENLIGNAFKFTLKGSITLTVRRLEERDRVEFRVADTGIGIESSQLDRIFNAFEQLKDAHTGNYNGVGLGLSIVKNYLELMDGEMHVDSRVNGGSNFTFSLPRSLKDSRKVAA
jgi:signal transduction histidine kinase/HAMP domain-containing protein